MVSDIRDGEAGPPEQGVAVMTADVAQLQPPRSIPPATEDDRLAGIRDVRRHVARGMLTNGGFQVGLLGLTAFRGFAVAAFVSRSDYGLWGLIALTLWTAMGLKSQFGAGEKYVQQSDLDQEHAFQRGFTMEVIFTSAAVPVAVAAVLAVVLVTGNWHVLAPAMLLLLLLPAAALQFPLAVFYRQMQFRRQRALMAVDPVVTAAVMIALAAAGAGYWSFVIGMLAGAWTLAIVVARACPYRLRLRYDRGTLRKYVQFSAPLLVSAISVLALFYVIYLVGSHAIGVAGLGAYTLAGNLLQFTDQADSIVTETLYPAVCAVKERIALLSEIFVKSNRLSLIWAVPFGTGMTLFASDLVRLILGSRWEPAVPVLQVMGLVTAVHHVGYNWAAFVKARGVTWPLAVSGVATPAVVIGAGVPLMYSDGLVGLAIAFALGECVSFLIRGLWMARFFTGVRIVRHLLRAFAPTAIAALPILLGRALLGSERTLLAAVMAFALYVVVTAGATFALERPLLSEAFGYLTRHGAQPA